MVDYEVRLEWCNAMVEKRISVSKDITVVFSEYPIIRSSDLIEVSGQVQSVGRFIEDSRGYKSSGLVFMDKSSLFPFILNKAGLTNFEIGETCYYSVDADRGHPSSRKFGAVDKTEWDEFILKFTKESLLDVAFIFKHYRCGGKSYEGSRRD